MNEYLDRLLEQIRCKKAHPYIRQELQSHMEEQIDANIAAGMDMERAEKEAVKDMGDPVETGISLDRIHKPQIAWKLLGMIVLISAAGLLIHGMIMRQFDGRDLISSNQYALHVIIGLAVMMALYFLDYTWLARYSKGIAGLLLAVCIAAAVLGTSVNGRTSYISVGRGLISIQPLMLFYIPVYGGILYQYRGLGYQGLVKAIIWMILPVILVFRIPSAMTAALMLISMMVMVTMAIAKGWFAVNKKTALMGFWGIGMVMPMLSLAVMYFGNGLQACQKARIQAWITNSGDANYITGQLRSTWLASQFIGDSGTETAKMLPNFYGDYILTYLSSAYGMLAAILICCILAVLIISVFSTMLRQKNQLGMVMGVGCGMILLVSFLVNVLENLGLLPLTATFLPFISAGGGYIVVCYGLIGIVLSIYRYKNIYPRTIKIPSSRIQMVIVKDR